MSDDLKFQLRLNPGRPGLQNGRGELRRDPSLSSLTKHLERRMMLVLKCPQFDAFADYVPEDSGG